MAKRRAISQKCQFDSHPLKIENRPEISACKWHATYHWKHENYKFALDLTSIKGLHKKLWPSKVLRILILGISSCNLGVLKQNDIWM
jgi:hypothetical protein